MKSLVRWAIENSPGLNIVIIAVFVVGFFSFSSLRRESFPEFDLDMILISVPYPGAAPQEVEEGICQKIEEAVRSLEGIKKVTASASEGSGSVVLELETGGRSPDRVLDEVRSEVDRIPSFPLEAEEPEIRLVTARRPAIRIGVLGPDKEGAQAELELRDIAEGIRNDLLLYNEISQVDLTGARDYQIDIEIEEDTLRSHGLTLKQVAEVIGRENRELPAGSIRGSSQEVLLRGNNRRTTGTEIAKLPLVTSSGGAVLTVGDLGNVRDEFVDSASLSRVNGRPALLLSVQRSMSEDLLKAVDQVKEYVADAKLPEGYDLVTWADESVEVRGRLNLLIKNGWQGLVLVFLLLVLFLELRLAFWVAMGIPFTLMVTGTYLLGTDQTLNMLSMFGFLMALGIVVDDAIVVGENIYAHRQMGKNTLQAALDGTVEVMPSVFASVLTTIIAFAPLLFVSGIMGKFMAVMPVAIIAMLTASLIESVTILPMHLAHRDNLLFKILHVVFYVFAWVVPVAHWLNARATSALEWYISRVYEPTLAVVLRNRTIFLAGCVAMLIFTAGLVRSGVTPFVFFPKLDGNTLLASVKFPDGTPEQVTDRWTKHVEDAFWRVAKRYEEQGEPIAELSYRVVGEQVSGGGPGAVTASGGSGSHVGSVEVELLPSEKRTIKGEAIAAAWREEVGDVPGTEDLTISSRGGGPAATAIEFKLLAAPEYKDELENMVERCKEELARFPGTYAVNDDSLPGKWEYRFRIREEAASLGVKTSDLAETVRAAFYGEEVMRVQRGRHEVKIMVRYPREERRQLANFDEIRVRSDDGIERPISELAEVDIARGYSVITRIDQLRCITVSSDVDETAGNTRQITQALRSKVVPELSEEFPHVSVRWEGQQEQTAESIGSLFTGFGVAVLAMFVLLSIEFKSYFQPLIILVIIPFGIVGVVFGHALQGLPVTLFSMFGLVALTGIIINDSIVLVDFINHRVREGLPLNVAVHEAGVRRFRPVLLTTVTTICGLLPILLETSFQAQLLIPMATSIAFGEMVATVLVLYLVPVCYSVYGTLSGMDRTNVDSDDTEDPLLEDSPESRYAPEECVA
ncbi:efflux RND transporter permease subunit [Aeoliella mucimassa]|uniref:Multidrug resistance protein MdtB n=1 Tax=Aeoliella mucimassa TaxID=2527972 RepID=A0A518ASE8_9BACT|nr:efflux RND transporter permease subunit [Aeoliella mucimassa]QDU57651.1 Multidrug resistance protein MdtB [Aeoliella mucimassa]